VLASLSYTSDNAKLLLNNFYKKGLNSIRKGKEESPRAFIIPKGQHDPYMTAYLVNQLKMQGIEVHQDGTDGDYVVLLDQPYRNFAVEKYDRDMILLQYGSKPLKDEEPYKGIVMGMPAKKEVKEEKKEDKAKKEEPYVLSGMVRNEQTIIGHGGIFNVPVGAGRVIAFTFDPLHRYLNHHEAPLVWNTIINWDHLR
jgi:23S rRNA G2069 N7-methylase RlmK/C1962 C5-methylase RlmI